jgi:flagellar biosynthesis/type III secretory pathway protein FliH
MPEYLTKRHGVWQFVHRVPQEFAHLDKRGVIKHSTHIEVIKDRRGTKAGKIADEMKRDLEDYWRGLSEGKAQEANQRYAEARRRARTYGFNYAETAELASRPMDEMRERLEKLENLMTALLKK